MAFEQHTDLVHFEYQPEFKQLTEHALGPHVRISWTALGCVNTLSRAKSTPGF